jgi:hypothetical protein
MRKRDEALNIYEHLHFFFNKIYCMVHFYDDNVDKYCGETLNWSDLIDATSSFSIHSQPIYSDHPTADAILSLANRTNYNLDFSENQSFYKTLFGSYSTVRRAYILSKLERMTQPFFVMSIINLMVSYYLAGRFNKVNEMCVKVLGFDIDDNITDEEDVDNESKLFGEYNGKTASFNPLGPQHKYLNQLDYDIFFKIMNNNCLSYILYCNMGLFYLYRGFHFFVIMLLFFF